MEEERWGARDLSYSAWHRARSISRYIGWEQAQLLSMCDADSVLWLEYDQHGKEPLALIEAAVDVGQLAKPATAITRLARRAQIPAYLILYQRSERPNPADRRWRDLSGMRVKRLWPRAELGWRQLKPDQFAKALLQIRAWSARRLDLQAANDPHWSSVDSEEHT